MSRVERRPRAALRRTLRSVLAVVAGYAALVLVSTVVQEIWLGGVSYRRSSLPTLLLAGIFTPLSAVIAGGVTAAIAGWRPWLHALPVMLAIAVETTALYRTGRVDGPLWFEASAALALIGGVALGFWLWGLIKTRLRKGDAPQ